MPFCVLQDFPSEKIVGHIAHKDILLFHVKFSGVWQDSSLKKIIYRTAHMGIWFLHVLPFDVLQDFHP